MLYFTVIFGHFVNGNHHWTILSYINVNFLVSAHPYPSWNSLQIHFKLHKYLNFSLNFSHFYINWNMINDNKPTCSGPCSILTFPKNHTGSWKICYSSSYRSFHFTLVFVAAVPNYHIFFSLEWHTLIILQFKKSEVSQSLNQGVSKAVFLLKVVVENLFSTFWGCLHSLAHGHFFHSQRQQCSIFNTFLNSHTPTFILKGPFWLHWAHLCNSE